jgi:hypothetical protein
MVSFPIMSFRVSATIHFTAKNTAEGGLLFILEFFLVLG